MEQSAGSEPLDRAVMLYSVPKDHPEFLLILPLFYIAKADGVITRKEMMTIAWNGHMEGIIAKDESGVRRLSEFSSLVQEQFLSDKEPKDTRILEDGIRALFQTFPQRTRNDMESRFTEACMEVLSASSRRLFMRKPVTRERTMLRRFIPESK